MTFGWAKISFLDIIKIMVHKRKNFTPSKSGNVKEIVNEIKKQTTVWEENICQFSYQVKDLNGEYIKTLINSHKKTKQVKYLNKLLVRRIYGWQISK